MSPKRRVIFGLLMVQLTLSVVGAGQIRLPQLPLWLGRGLEAYAAASGAANVYSFFAPGVGTELRPTFELIRADGTRRALGFADDANREVRLRLIKIVTTFWDEISDTKLRRALSASLVGKVFAQNPGTSAVVLRLDEYALPDMKNYLEGERPKWNLFYQAKFAQRVSTKELAHEKTY